MVITIATLFITLVTKSQHPPSSFPIKGFHTDITVRNLAGQVLYGSGRLKDLRSRGFGVHSTMFIETIRDLISVITLY